MTDPLAELRKPFPKNKIGKLPKITCSACSKKTCTAHKRQTCQECGNYITTAHMHLDYVGHAEVTRRLLDADPSYRCDPIAYDQAGTPILDGNNGLWVRLTVHDKDGAEVSRLGYGDAPGKSGGNAVKEAIGDGLRNAAMRFGVALDLWSKERDDYIAEEGELPPPPPPPKPYSEWLAAIVASSNMGELTKVGGEIAAADLSDGDRKALRDEFTRRVNEIKGTP